MADAGIPRFLPLSETAAVAAAKWINFNFRIESISDTSVSLSSRLDAENVFQRAEGVPEEHVLLQHGTPKFALFPFSCFFFVFLLNFPSTLSLPSALTCHLRNGFPPQALSSCLMLADGKTVVCSSWDNNVYVEKAEDVDFWSSKQPLSFSPARFPSPSAVISTLSRTAGGRTLWWVTTTPSVRCAGLRIGSTRRPGTPPSRWRLVFVHVLPSTVNAMWQKMNMNVRVGIRAWICTSVCVHVLVCVYNYRRDVNNESTVD